MRRTKYILFAIAARVGMGSALARTIQRKNVNKGNVYYCVTIGNGSFRWAMIEPRNNMVCELRENRVYYTITVK